MYDIGRSKRATKAFSFDDIAIVPSRRTRGLDQVNLGWKIDAVSFDFPILAAPMDSVMSPATAIEMGRQIAANTPEMVQALELLGHESLGRVVEDPTGTLRPGVSCLVVPSRPAARRCPTPRRPRTRRTSCAPCRPRGATAAAVPALPLDDAVPHMVMRR